MRKRIEPTNKDLLAALAFYIERMDDQVVAIELEYQEPLSASEVRNARDCFHVRILSPEGKRMGWIDIVPDLCGEEIFSNWSDNEITRMFVEIVTQRAIRKATK